jgi:hypothetical protein
MKFKIRKLFGVGALVIGAMALTSSAMANTVVLNFAGLNGNAEEKPLDYYNGGTGSLGSGPGTNYGISFAADALSCSGQPGGACNTAQIPGGAVANALFFLTGPGDIMNVAAGFTTGFSFYYAAAFNPGSVSIWSGLNGTGTLLQTLALPVTGDGSGTTGCFGTNFCPYTPIGVAFAGTAESVNFTGTANQIAFADITLGSSTAGGTVPVPEPVILALLASGLLGFSTSRRKKNQI